MKATTICAILLVASTQAFAQTSTWTVQVIPPPISVPVGMCMAVQVTLMDPVTKDVPRNPQGYRITMADFDLSVNGGQAAAGHQIDPNHYEVCGCPGGAGQTSTVTARYPAQGLPAAQRVAGVSVEQSATVAIAAPKGPLVPPACAGIASRPANPPANPPASPPPASRPTASPTAAVATPPARGAPPERIVPANPSDLRATQTGPNVVKLAWSAVKGATSYVVFAPNLPNGGYRIQDYGGQGHYMYAAPGAQEFAVASYFPGNVSTPASAFARVTINMITPAGAAAPGPQGPAGGVIVMNPGDFRAVETTPGTVRFSWTQVYGASLYTVYGPGFPAGVSIVGGGSFLTFNVQPGLQDFRLVATFPGNVTTPEAEFPHVSLLVGQGPGVSYPNSSPP